MAGDLDLDFETAFEAEPPAGFDPDAAAALARCALGREGATGRWAVTLALVHDDRLRALHRDFMGVDTPTDVMTFPTDDPDLDGGGDIVISVDRAAEQAPEYGLDAADEVTFLLVHGLLHLCGWDDTDPETRQRMLARQSQLIASCATQSATPAS
ncbi:MAG: rRNA maturation RNase YbeY [Thermomicrobiales bacterium]|nr:rRNA maturation RNase YbeY [Thermomicrobiales bacterium]